VNSITLFSHQSNHFGALVNMKIAGVAGIGIRPVAHPTGGFMISFRGDKLFSERTSTTDFSFEARMFRTHPAGAAPKNNITV